MAHAAAGDCESVHGRVGQPVNALTSGAYLVAAAWIWWRAPRGRVVWTALLAWLGLGSIGYHGPGNAAGKVLHDSALLALPAVVGAAAVRERQEPNPHLVASAALLAGAVVVHRASRTGRRACRPESVWQGHGLWHVLSAVALAWWADGERPG